MTDECCNVRGYLVSLDRIQILGYISPCPLLSWSAVESAQVVFPLLVYLFFIQILKLNSIDFTFELSHCGVTILHERDDAIRFVCWGYFVSIGSV